MATTFTIAGNISTQRTITLTHRHSVLPPYCQILLTAADTPESHHRFPCTLGDKAGKRCDSTFCPNSHRHFDIICIICLYSIIKRCCKAGSYSCNQYRDNKKGNAPHIQQTDDWCKSCKCKSIAYIFFFPNLPIRLPMTIVAGKTATHVISVIIDANVRSSKIYV